jgi:hypothetical protein
MLHGLKKNLMNGSCNLEYIVVEKYFDKKISNIFSKFNLYNSNNIL